MRLSLRSTLVAAGLAAGAALVLGDAPALASTAGTESAVVAGPFGDYQSCHLTQRDYQRYYTIYHGCFQLDTGQWIFTYDDGIPG